MLAFTATTLAAASGGCSFIFSQGAPADHAQRAAFDCGESVAPPVLDTVFAGLAALTAATVKRDRFDTDSAYHTAVGLYVGAAALDAASAIYGYAASGDCREARQARAAALAQARALPPPYGDPYTGAPPPLWPPALARPPAPAAPPALRFTPPPQEPPSPPPSP